MEGRVYIEEGNPAAFFDVDGTVVSKMLARYYFRLKWPLVAPRYRPLWLIFYVFQVIIFGLLDVFSRGLVTRIFYFINMRGMEVAVAKKRAHEIFGSYAKDRIFALARKRIEDHKARGETVFLVTASPKFVIAPLAEFLGIEEKHIFAVELEERRRNYTGKLTTGTRQGKTRARLIQSCVSLFGIDLEKSSFYGDSRGDRYAFRMVGNPVVVNPKPIFGIIIFFRNMIAKYRHLPPWSVKRWKDRLKDE